MSLVAAFVRLVYNATGVTLSDGQDIAAQADGAGNLKTTLATEIAGENRSDGVLFSSPRAISSTTGAWTQYASAAKIGTAGVSVRATAGRVRSVVAVNTNATTLLYLLVVDKATAPVNNDLPITAMALPANTGATVRSWEVLDFGESGLTQASGFGLALSTTADKVTLPVTSDAMVFARHQ